jgi:hypothetical protein
VQINKEIAQLRISKDGVVVKAELRFFARGEAVCLG